MSIEQSAAFAEVLVSPGYLGALNAAFNQNPESYTQQKFEAEDIIFGAIQSQRTDKERAWEARRQAALADIRGTDIGPFYDYIQGQEGTSAPAELTLEDLGRGADEVVRTNGRIIGLNKISQDPIDFLEDAVALVEARKKQNIASVGPENYASSLKFFTDKLRNSDTNHPDKSEVKAVVNNCLRGFMLIAQKDKPNFVEMTNIYSALSTLPTGVVDKKFSGQLISHSLEQLPTYSKGTINVMLSAVGKLDLTETGQSSADLVDLALRKGQTFDTTLDMQYGLRAVSNLPRTPAANRCFKTFLDLRNNLEEPMNIDAIEYVNSRLLITVRDVIDDPELSMAARELAEKCSVRAMNLYRYLQDQAVTTPTVLKDLKASVQRIRSSFTQI